MSTNSRKITVQEGVEVRIEVDKIIVKGPKGEIERVFPTKNLKIEIKDKQITISSLQTGARARALIGTFNAHILNMIKGVQEPYIYKLKVCSSHFPINVKLSGQEFLVSNFLGEKRPKKVVIPKNVTMKIEGDQIIVESIDKELAGKLASNIEHLTKIRSRDRRVFQDGIYITEKAGKPIV